jgi:hypothetical protein
MSSIREHDRVILTRDFGGSGLVSGDVGTVVHVYEGGKAFEVEFISLSGDTIAVETLTAADVRQVTPADVVHARSRVA